MKSVLGIALAVAGLSACSKEPDQPVSQSNLQPPKPAAEVLVVRVDGMIKSEGGKTWMSWPDAVKEALEGLRGIERVESDLDRDLFRLTYRPGQKPDEQTVLDAVKGLNYRPFIVRGENFGARTESARGAISIPPTIQRLLDKAKAENKLLIVKLTADWWASCKQMSVQTFGDPRVKKVIEASFVFSEIDVDKGKDAAKWFAGSAIPDTRIMTSDGTEMDRVVGFMDAEAFVARLRAVLEKRKWWIEFSGEALKMNENNVVVYSSPTWGSCKSVKEFLTAKGVPFTIKDVTADAAAMGELERVTGGRQVVPVIIAGDQVIIGFDRGKLQRALGLSWSSHAAGASGMLKFPRRRRTDWCSNAPLEREPRSGSVGSLRV